MSIIIILIIWFFISYLILYNNSSEIIRQDISLGKCCIIYLIYIIFGPLFLLNNIVLIILDYIDPEGGYFDDY